MNHYKLLTPGPLTTTDTVKQEMLFDHCTWDEDYKNITQTIRKQLLSPCSRVRGRLYGRPHAGQRDLWCRIRDHQRDK